MPTYAELGAEPWWNAEYEPEHFAAFLAKLRTHYGHTRSQTGSKGDYRHLTGRHRSIAWCLNSKYCTNRSYGTRDQRDLRGDRNALRGFDLGVQGAELRAVSTRVDAAVRAGKLRELAEWFGTKDGQTVVGWFEGHASSSDSSHLWHFHGGIWTESVNDAAFLDRLYDVITGDDMPTAAEVWTVKGWTDYVIQSDGSRLPMTPIDALFRARADARAAVVELAALRVVLEQLAAALVAGGGSVDMAAIDAKLTALREAVEADTRDAVADLAEGGADAVRADT